MRDFRFTRIAEERITRVKRGMTVRISVFCICDEVIFVFCPVVSIIKICKYFFIDMSVSPTDYVAPLKKRRLARESLSSEQSFTPPATPTHIHESAVQVSEHL